MILFHIAIALTLIALGLGAAFLLWADGARGGVRTFAKIMGYIIGIIAAISLICTFISMLKYAKYTHMMMKRMPGAGSMMLQQGGNPASQPQMKVIKIQRSSTLQQPHQPQARHLHRQAKTIQPQKQNNTAALRSSEANQRTTNP